MDKRGYDFSQSLEKKTFNFGPRNPGALSVDASLAGLFDCLTMECSGVLVHPQWKHFRHIQMLKNDQTRLSNGIWRSWHIQFQKGRRPLFCWFDIDAELDHHNRPEAVVLEGKYWKRNKDAVAREYRKWRSYYYKQRIQKLGQALDDPTASQNMDDMRNWPQASQVDTTFVNYFQSDGTAGLMDTLLFDMSMPYTRTSLDTDIMQPNLDMLNPTLDELQDLFEPMDVAFARSTASGLFGVHNSFPAVATLSMLSNSRPQPGRGTRHPQNVLSDILQLSVSGPSTATYEQYSTTAPSFLTQLGFPPALRSQLAMEAMQQQGGYPSSAPGGYSSAQGGGLEEEYHLSPTSFLRLSSLEEGKDSGDPAMELGDAQQFISFALKPKPASEEGVPLARPSSLAPGSFQSLESSSAVPQAPQTSLGLTGSASSGHSSALEYQRPHQFSPQLSPLSHPLVQSKSPTLQYSSRQFGSQTPPPPSDGMPPPPTSFARTQQYSPQHSRTPSSPHPPSTDPMPPPQSAPTSFVTRMLPYSPQHSQTPPSPNPFTNTMPPPPPTMTTPTFPRVMSSGSLASSSSHPPLERGTSEPTRSLQAQVRMLTAQQEEQMRELERQQGLAQLQYNQVLEQYLRHSTEQTSQQQQQMLQSVLADPNLVNILKSVLLSGQGEGGGGGGGGGSGSGSGTLVVKEEEVGLVEDADPSCAGFLKTGTAGRFPRGEEFQLSPAPTSPAQVKSLQQVAPPTQAKLLQVAPPPQAKPLQVAPPPQAKPLQVAPPPQAKPLQVAPPPQAKPLQVAPPPQAKPLQVQQSTPGQTMVSPSSASSLAHLVCPTQLAKATGISDFQSRLLVAAAQASSSESPAPLSSALLTTSSRSPHSAELDVAYSPSVLQRRLKNPKQLTSEEKIVYKELRRQSHISAEQKRRGSIKQGFDHLQSLLINPATYPTGKVSKTAILEKCIEYIEDSHQKRLNREKKVEALKKEIAQLNRDISDFQQTLPASGAPITRQRFEENRHRFREYVQRKTLQNYKFWIFSIILQQLFDSYNATVATGNTDELCRTVLAWFEQKCSLPSLRPVVFSSLKELSVKTSILSDPSQVPQQLKEYASQRME
ncbi:hypothetical protein EMCRGX_G024084 [Ephydatia muelleri]